MPMLFAQIKAPVVAPASSAEVRPSDPVRRQREAEEKYLRERAEREEREALEQRERDRMELELRARQIRLERERSGLVAPGIGRSLAGVGASLRGALNPDGTPVRFGGTEYAATATLVQGYNDNVVQTIDDPADRLVRRRGSPFIGLDTMGIVQYLGQRVEHDFRLQVRGQHYTPISRGYDFSDDGTINVGYMGRLELAPTTTLAAFATTTLSTLNSSRQSDGLVFRVDPYSTQRTFTLSMARIAVEQELSPRWRFVQGADVSVSTILHDAPIILGSGQRVIPRGIDFVQPRVDSTLFHDFGYEDIGFARVSYEMLFSRLALDLNSNPPRNAGPIVTHLAQAHVGWTHLFSPSFSTSTTVGMQIATPIATDVDQRAILSPSALQSAAYVTPKVFATAGVGYSYGSVNPRLGFGTAVDANATIVLSPWERTAVLRRMSILVNGQASRAALQASSTSRSILNVYAASLEIRYGVSSSLALMAGYNFRSAAVSSSEVIPPLWRHIVFAGITVFFSTQRVMPPLVNFAPPLQGG